MLYLCLICCISAAAFFALVLVALFALTPVDLKVAPNTPARRIDQIKELLAQPRDLLVTLIFCDVSAAILLQNTVAHLFGDRSSWLITVGIPVILTLFLGEILPKSLALPYRTRIAAKVAPLILTLRQLLRPICHPISRLTSSITQLVFPYLKPNQELSKEELRYLVSLSQQGGILDEKEAIWLQNYLAIDEQTIKERMHPRNELVYYTVGHPIEHLEECFKHQEEVVVCRGDLQNVLGTLSAREYFLHKGSLSNLIDLLQYPFYAPESLPLTALFTDWLQSPSRCCLVVDEYGVISGWLMRHDLYRLILKEPISEQFDEKRPVLISAKMELQEFFQRYGYRLESPHNMSTVGGWITERLGEIPKNGTTLSHEGLLFQIVEADPNKIRTISIKRSAP